MKKIEVVLVAVILLLSFNVNAQKAPVGKKTLEVKESYKGEYMQNVTDGDLSNVVLKAMKKRVPKKLKKYGFESITITEIGKVLTPVSVATKMGAIAGGNKELGKAELEVAKTKGQIENAVDKMYSKKVDSDWKFQVNLIDNKTKEIYKIRLSLSYNPKYIIKESNELINFRE